MMKNLLVLLLAVVALTAPVFAESCGEADPNIVITVTANGNNLDVTFSDAEAVPVGVSFQLDITGAALADPNLSTIDGAFNTPIDWAFDNQGDPNNFTNGTQTPVALQGAPGVAPIGSTSFSVSAGALGTDPNIAGAIATIALDGAVGGVTLSPDCTRGGVVAADGVEMDVTFVFDPGTPVCPTCPGDATGDGVVNVFDLSNLSLFLQTNGLPPFYNVPVTTNAEACRDRTGDGVVNVFDLSNLSLFLQTNGLPPFYNVPCP